MKRLLFLFGLMIHLQVFADKDLIKEIRLLYQRSASDKAACEKLVQSLHQYTEQNNPTMAGYKACGTIMMANHKLNPLEKFSAFKEGKSLLEKCIQREYDNAELRFLRFTVQCNAPSFLQYNGSVKEDKHFLLRSVKELKDTELRRLIIFFLLQSQEVTASEKKLLR